jgi:DNA polymerase-3 subunit alpha
VHQQGIHLLLTQYDGKVIEDAGVIKMDFLGLKTLTIIRDALRMIEANHGIEIDIDDHSAGRPEDLRALPARRDQRHLPVRKRGHAEVPARTEGGQVRRPHRHERAVPAGSAGIHPHLHQAETRLEKIVYDLPEMEELLKETYGVTVYQEQVMLLSQKLAGFTKGDADVLRKAMGKKDRATLDKMKGKFLEGTAANGLRCQGLRQGLDRLGGLRAVRLQQIAQHLLRLRGLPDRLAEGELPERIHGQRAHPFGGQIDKITFFMEECRRMGIKVLGPDVNESQFQFSVNKAGQIRFGLGAVKGVGEGAVESIVNERRANAARHERLRPDAPREPAQCQPQSVGEPGLRAVPSIGLKCSARTSSTAPAKANPPSWKPGPLRPAAPGRRGQQPGEHVRRGRRMRRHSRTHPTADRILERAWSNCTTRRK